MTISSPEELAQFVRKERRYAWRAFFDTGEQLSVGPFTFGAEAAQHQRHGWTNHHVVVDYQGREIHLKMPKPAGRLVMYGIQPMLHHIYNDDFIVHEALPVAYAREMRTYGVLEHADVPTLTDINPEIEDALGHGLGAIATLQVENVNAADEIARMKKDDLGAAYTLALDAARLLRRIHDAGIIWGDARFANMLLTSDALLPIDFEVKPNPEKPLDWLKAKDLERLCIDAVYRFDAPPAEIIPALVGFYSPSSAIIRRLRSLEHSGAPGCELFFFTPVYGMGAEKVSRIRECLAKL